MTEKPTLTKYSDGTKLWWLNGKLRRKDGPAIEWADGTKLWWLNDKLHREDGPAYEGADGTKLWYLNGELHREDGPAIERADGTKGWYLNGKEITGSELDILLMRAWMESGKNYFEKSEKTG